jgi:hypothetical protein
MECRDAQFYLRLRRHAADELGPDVTGALNNHLAVCPACAADARAAASFDRAMASAMRAVPVPSNLREQIVASVAAKQGAILRRKFYRAATATAAAVALVFLGLGIFSSTRPTLDPAELARTNDELYTNPERSTQEWLAEQKLPTQFPAELDFDYHLHVFHGFEEVQKRHVPVIQFRSRTDPAGFAKVYVFREDGRFDLKGLQDSHASFTLAKHVVGRGVHYVVVHTGGPLDGLKPFLRVQPPRGGPVAAAGRSSLTTPRRFALPFASLLQRV